jgi:hypothetical protein
MSAGPPGLWAAAEIIVKVIENYLQLTMLCLSVFSHDVTVDHPPTTP